MRNFRTIRHVSYIFLPFSSVKVWNTTEHGVSSTHRNKEARKQQLPDLTTTATD